MQHATSSTGREHMRTLIVMAAVLVVLGIAYFIASEASKEPDGTAEEGRQSLLSVVQEDITGISWEYAGQTYQLDFDGSTWKDASAPDIAVEQTSANELAAALADASISRILSADEISDAMELDNPSVTITVFLADESSRSLEVGAQTSDSQGYYAKLDGEDGAVIADSSLGSFLVTMMDLYQRDSSPSATLVDSLVIERAEGQTLSFVYDAEGVEQSYTPDYTWSVEDGTTCIATSNAKANAVVSLINHVSWNELVSVDGAQDASYGFDSPTLTAALSYTTTSEEETGETDEDGNAKTETVKTPHTFVLTVGGQAEDGDYYAKTEGSDKVYTLSQDDVAELLSANIDSLRPDDVCLMDWDTVDSIDITVGEATETLSLTRSENVDDEGNAETVTTYSINGSELDELDAKNLFEAINALQSEGERTEKPAEGSSPELCFTFHRNTDTFTEMILSFTRYDNNFYLVSFNGEERLLVSKNDVADLMEMISEW